MQVAADLPESREMLMEQEQDGLAETAPRYVKRSSLLGMVAAGMLLFAAAAFASRGSTGLRGSSDALESVVSEYINEACDERIASACDFIPWFHPDKVVHQNLGGHGPDHGAEGLVWEVSDRSEFSATFGKKFLIVVNSTSEYHPAEPKRNGKFNDYASINMKPGSHARTATFSLRLLESDTLKEFYPAFFSMTFFDFDEQKLDKATESLTVHDYSAFMTSNGTELDVSHIGPEHATPCVKFSATTQGTGSDNPQDPMHLNTLQFNRAVSIVFTGKHQVDFELSVGPGEYARFFIFTFRSSLACAINADTDKKEDLTIYTPEASHEVWREWCEPTTTTTTTNKPADYPTVAPPATKKPKTPWMLYGGIGLLLLIVLIIIIALVCCKKEDPAPASGGYGGSGGGGGYGENQPLNRY